MAATSQSGARLAGIDGLRAVAALWVLLFHVRAFSHAKLWPGVDLVVRSGSTGVSLFLVLSGFCLYLPVAGGNASRFRTRAFLRRRCARLLPAYLASIIAVLAAYLLTDGRLGLPKLNAHDLLLQTATHATLTHQLFPSTFYGLNGAYWSLGLEWELYLTLPLLVLAVRRLGLIRTVLAVTTLTVVYRLALFYAAEAEFISRHGISTTVVLPNLFLGRWSEFALGMCAAEVYRTGQSKAWSRRWLLPALLAATLGLLVANNPLEHVLFGMVFFALVLGVLAGHNAVARAMCWRPLVAVGTMSYSLYLVHQPVVEMASTMLRARYQESPGVVFATLLMLLPVVLAIAWLLFMTVERRSIKAASPRRSQAQLPVAGLLSASGRDGPDCARFPISWQP